jgi:HSP20 family molecular chaperone IbpA
MSFFGDDSFDEMVNELFGGRPTTRRKRVLSGEQEERVIDFIEEDKNIYFVFELSGYSFEDVTVNIRNHEIEVNAVKEKLSDVQPYLKEKLVSGTNFKKELPGFVKHKEFQKTFKNGVLEVKFKRK